MQALRNITALSTLVFFTALTSAQAAIIYDKDGTTLNVGGRVEAAWFSTHASGNGAGDSTIADRVRFGLSGRTKLAEGIFGFGKYELQWAHNGNSSEALNTTTRDMLVGVEFDKFGTLQAGRFLNHSYYIEEVTDIFSWIAGGVGELNGTRNSGKLRYSYDDYGIHVGAELQSAVNNYALYTIPLLDLPQKNGAENYTENYNVDHGYSFTLGYTTPEVLFGPINIRLAYEYLRFQDKEKSGNALFLKDAKSGGIGISWGSFARGLYLAGFYEQRHSELKDNPLELSGTIKERSYELAISYGFENGIYTTVAYEGLRKERPFGKTIKARTVPFELGYGINRNFKVWLEGRFATNSDSESGFAENVYAAGARYSF